MTVLDPYSDVDFASLTDPQDTGKPPKIGTHFHSRVQSPGDTRHGVIDYGTGEGSDSEGHYITEPFSYFYYMHTGGKSHWPWDDPPRGESRDPKELDVVAVPAHEYHMGMHIYAIFSTGSNFDVRGRGIPEKMQDTIEDNRTAEGYPEAIVGFAHARRYFSWPPTDREYEPFRFNVERMAAQDKPSIFSVSRDGPGYPHTDSRSMWDKLLTDFAPDYRIWFNAHADPGPNSDFEVGKDVDRRYVRLLVQEGDYDVSDQEGSRSDGREAMANGSSLVMVRDSWDESSEDAPEPPMPTDAGVDGGTIYVESDADTVEWITANGETAGTGESVSVNDCDRYARAELWNSDESALTLTQPWGIAE